MTESLEAKIRKLLTLAERAGTPQEAESASRAAERLMLKWGIEEATVRSKMGKDEMPEAIVTKHTVQFPARLHRARMPMVSAIVRGMGNMRCYFIKGGDVRKVAIVGFESDVDRALMYIPSILIQADHALASWWKDFPDRKYMKSGEANREKRQFMFGFANEVQRRLTEMRAEEVTEAGTGSALVLRDRGKMVDDFYDKIPLRSGRPLKAGGMAGGSAGRAAGARANLGGSALPGARGAIGRG